MPRKNSVRWHPGANAWVSQCGEVGRNGRRKPEYFREIPNTPKGKKLAEQALESFLKRRDRADAERTEDRDNPRLWAGVIRPFLAHVSGLVDAGKASDDTYRTHRDRLVKWAKSPDAAGVLFKDRLAGSLTPEDGEAWVAWLGREGRALKGGARSGLSPTRVDGLLRTAMACLNWAAAPVPGREPRVILRGGNPFAGVKADAARKRRVRVATRAEIARFLRAARADVEPWHAGGRSADDWYRPGRVARCAACRAARKGGPCRRSHNLRAAYFRATLLLCRLQAASGTRPKELCTATWAEQLPGRPGWSPGFWTDPETGHGWGLIVIPGKTYRKTNRARTILVPPLLSRAIERLRSRGLHPELIFPRLARSGGPGRWTTDGLDARVRKWRDAAGLSRDFVLYALRHRYYTTAVGKAGLTADQAGALGGTSGKVVESTYLQEDLAPQFEGAARVRRAARG